jgi:hypothetical protein
MTGWLVPHRSKADIFNTIEHAKRKRLTNHITKKFILERGAPVIP